MSMVYKIDETLQEKQKEEIIKKYGDTALYWIINGWKDVHILADGSPGEPKDHQKDIVGIILDREEEKRRDEIYWSCAFDYEKCFLKERHCRFLCGTLSWCP